MNVLAAWSFFDWVWPDALSLVIRDGFMGLLRIAREWLWWLLDPTKIFDAAGQIITLLWNTVQDQLPASASGQLDAFFAQLHGLEFVKLLKCVLWAMDQVMFAGPVMALFLLVISLIPAFLMLRWIIFVLHQVWGTGDGS